MLADPSDIRALSVAHHRHAADLTAVAADLRSSQIDPDAFGSAGAGFLIALNAALTREAHHAAQLAERLAAAAAISHRAAASYAVTDERAGQALSPLRT